MNSPRVQGVCSKALPRSEVKTAILPFLLSTFLLCCPVLAESAADTTAKQDAAAEIEKWDFGVVTDRTGPTKGWKLHPVVVVPNLPGVQYAWKLKCKNTNPMFVREEFTLPEPPSTWKIKQGEASSELLKGGQQCVLESFQPTDDGWLGHAWTVSNGDPSGRYEIKIWLNGKLAHHFTFNVSDPGNFGEAKRDW